MRCHLFSSQSLLDIDLSSSFIQLRAHQGSKVVPAVDRWLLGARLALMLRRCDVSCAKVTINRLQRRNHIQQECGKGAQQENQRPSTGPRRLMFKGNFLNSCGDYDSALVHTRALLGKQARGPYRVDATQNIGRPSWYVQYNHCHVSKTYPHSHLRRWSRRRHPRPCTPQTRAPRRPHLRVSRSL